VGLQPQDGSKLEQWLLFLKSDKETMEALAKESSTMREAFEEIRCLSDDPATRAAAISREIHLKDQLQRELDAKADGKQEGKEEGKTEIILNMYKKQYPVGAIADITNIPLENVLRKVKTSLQ